MTRDDDGSRSVVEPPGSASGDASLPASALLAQAERDEDWALVVLLGWGLLLIVIVGVLVLSPRPWGALVGLLFWGWGARTVFVSFNDAVARTAELREEVERTGSEPAKAPSRAP